MTHAEADSGVFGHGVLGTFHFGWAYIEITDDLTSTLSMTESPLSELASASTSTLAMTETAPAVLESSATSTLSATETYASVLEYSVAEILNIYTCYNSGIFGGGMFGYMTFGVLCPASELASAHSSTLTATETDASTIQSSYTDTISFTESIASTYEMSYSEIVTIIETVIAAYDWKTSCVGLTCTLDKPRYTYLFCQMKCG